jgi:hypothetical protein
MDDQDQPDDQGFIVEAQGPDGVFGVFEDDGETGYLYIYEPEGAGIIQHLHIYDRSKLPAALEETDVSVDWEGNKCSVAIQGLHRGTIETKRG